MLKYFFALIFSSNFICAELDNQDKEIVASNKKPPMNYDKVMSELLDHTFTIEKRLATPKSFLEKFQAIFYDKYLVADYERNNGIIANIIPLSDEYVFNFKLKRDMIYLSGLLTYIAYKKGYLDKLKDKCKDLHKKLIKSNKNNKK